MCSVTCSCSKTGLGLIFRSFTTMAAVPFLHSKKVRRATVLSPMLSPLGANKFPNAMGLERSLPGVIEGRDVRFWHKADIVKSHNAPTATCRGCLARAPSKECGRCLLTKLGLAQFTARLFWRFTGDWWLVFTPCRRMRLRLAIRDQFARTHNS